LASEAAVAEAEEAQERAGMSAPTPRDGRAGAKRNQGRLPKELPRIERVIEPETTLCPCG